MSTTITRGFKIKGIKSLDTAFFMMPDFRLRIMEYAERKAASLLFDRACFIYDEIEILNRTGQGSSLSMALTEIRSTLQSESESNIGSYFDFGFEIALGITTDKTVIGVTYGNDYLHQEFLKLDDIVEYSYWDNADKECNVTTREWTKRRGHWNEVLYGDGIPSRQMFSMAFTPSYQFPLPSKELMSEQNIIFETRLKKISDAVTIDRAKEKFNLVTQREILSFILHDNNYNILLDEVMIELKDKLKPTLTLDDLIKEI